MNQIVDHLSKDGILLGNGELRKWKFQNDTNIEDDLGPISA